MRHPVFAALCLTGTALLSACGRDTDAEVEKVIKDVNVIDESNLSDIMLTVGDPNEAVTYFANTLKQNPDRPDLRRGLAKSLVRANRPQDAAEVWGALVNSGQGTNEDRVGFADALIRSNNWAQAEAELNKIPPTHETYERYRLEAMVADSRKNWKKADSFYEIAAGLTTKPANVINNWGYSKLTRGEYAGAEKLFTEALSYDSTLFTAKNNLVLARGAQRKYDMPVIPMTQTERAELLYTLGLAAVKQGDVNVGRGLLEQAVETHPQYFEAAARSLEALEGRVKN
ncbi:Tetratricopeptide repeat-containing protein [Gemmobacter aquatilis]|uniref:Tetratricopeptide repeat-containing protein n=1 Tax=Gemmobacter aquatilis TaxID=933059 RepID=A0A1H8DFR5_9RHOB|nr:tetratricopeptide repeat protein [Gemmobacter aquatilis]SEN05986.1 Tetratricopeptide repeat-containing protein [Gemmobacter aquatilis]